MNFKNKKVLVTGGTGLIGRELVESILKKEPAEIQIVSLDEKTRAHPDCKFNKMDLRIKENCAKAVKGMDIVMHLMGNKGSPKMAAEKPADMFVSHLQCNTNMMNEAFLANVGWYLMTSSVAVYHPAPVMHEDDVWKTMPSKHDWFAGWAKRMGELQAEAYNIQYGWNNVSIVRPSNVYGRYDNFDPINSMVIPSLIRRIIYGESPLNAWGDGSPIRDFIHAKDCADAMITIVEKEIISPINIGSGSPVSIKELVNTLISITDEKPVIFWDTTKHSGDASRLLDITRLNEIGFCSKISLAEGLKEVYDFYKNTDNRNIVNNGYNIFTEKRETK
jgi:GDP-L-fucose synthase